MVDGLERLQDRLLVQCRTGESGIVLGLVDSASGIVITGRIERRAARAWADQAHHHGTTLLLDADAYSGSARRRASAGFDPAWLHLQREADLPVLSDSGYLAPEDTVGLDAVLGRARAAGDVIATLPLHASWWFDPRYGLHPLIDAVHAADVPIALVLEHRDDPYEVARTLRGVLELLHVGVPVLQLRCDVSGLGLLCHGAHASAVGTGSSLRHLFPLDDKRGGFGGPRVPSTLVRDCMAFHKIDAIARAVAADPDSSLWRGCTCAACNGRTLDEIDQAPENQKDTWAFRHAIYVLLDLHAGLLGPTFDTTAGAAADPTIRMARQQSWRSHCSSAQFRYTEINEAGLPWKTPAFLRNWATIPVPSHAI